MSTRKQVWQYRCDFCTKRNLSASAIAKHEKHCTVNPNRICRMCSRLGKEQKPIAELVACLSLDTDGYGMTELRELIDCPVCVLAAIRQSKIMETYREQSPERWNETGPVDLKWDFKTALAETWAKFNAEAEPDYY